MVRFASCTLNEQQIYPPPLHHHRLKSEDRPPVCAVETAMGAIDLRTFDWPVENTAIVVGGEGQGISQPVLKALRPGYDQTVYIPMFGRHTSLNVAAALACALYEYRRHWPGPGGGAATSVAEPAEDILVDK